MALRAVEFFRTFSDLVSIQPEGGGKQFFVHVSTVGSAGMDELQERQYFWYEVVMDYGKQAAGSLVAT